MAKVVKVKATRRNGKVVKAHTRTVKGGISKSGAGKELSGKEAPEYDKKHMNMVHELAKLKLPSDPAKWKPKHYSSAKAVFKNHGIDF